MYVEHLKLDDMWIFILIKCWAFWLELPPPLGTHGYRGGQLIELDWVRVGSFTKWTGSGHSWLVNHFGRVGLFL